MHLEPLYPRFDLPRPLPDSEPDAATATASSEGTALSPLEEEGGKKGREEEGGKEEAGRERGREGDKVAERALPVVYSCPFSFLLKSVDPSRLATNPVLLGVFVDRPGVEAQSGREGGGEGGVLMVPGNSQSRRAVLVVHAMDSKKEEMVEGRAIISAAARCVEEGGKEGGRTEGQDGGHPSPYSGSHAKS